MLSPTATPVLKRSHSDIEATNTSDQPTVKRPRVQFKSENTIHTLKQWDDTKTLSLIKEEVKRALEKKLAHEDTLFNALCDLLSQKPNAVEVLPSKVLKKYLSAIQSLATTVQRTGHALVEAITQISWLGRDEEFVRMYTVLLHSLVSKHPGYAQVVYSSLLDRFVNLRPHHGRLQDEARVPMAQMLDRLHDCIQTIYSIPSAQSQLPPQMRLDFPFPTDSLRDHMSFVANILRIASYLPELKAPIVGMVFDKVAALDSQLQLDLEDLQEELSYTLEQDLGEQVNLLMAKALGTGEVQEEEDTSDSDAESEVDEFEENPQQKKLHVQKQEVAKVEGMMLMLFNHLEPDFDPSRASKADQLQTFEQLWGMFQRVVLTMERSRFVQFILFRYAQSSEELCLLFIKKLTKVITTPNEDRLLVRAASAYLASFISRAAIISQRLTRGTFRVLASQLERLRTLHELNGANGLLTPDLNRFAQYYTIYQCLMYIFCFRWKDLLHEDIDENNFDPHTLTWLPDTVDIFRRNAYSRLNPLKVCAPVIVKQFSTVVQQLQVMFVDNLMAQNKRIRLTRSMASTNGGFSILAESNNNAELQGEAHLMLSAFFPFDPYKLPLSSRYVDGQYNEWQPVPGFGASPAPAVLSEEQEEVAVEDEKDAEGEDDDDEDEEEEEDE